MNDPYSRIKQIEKQIFDDAEMADKLERYERRGCSTIESEAIAIELRTIDVRIANGREEIKRIEAELRKIKANELEFNVTELNKPRERRVYPPIKVRPRVNFYGLDEVRKAA